MEIGKETMCYICNNSPHSVACPFYKNNNAPKCVVCGSYICNEDASYKLKNEIFHKECLRELNGEDVCEVLGIKPQ
ncbi:MAG: hypothetical protein IKA02_02675 [Clostridia bacterium]|nr:hypothetical protein [Clostridia bacterium]